MNETAIKLISEVADEANTIAKYSGDMMTIIEDNPENVDEIINTYRSVIQEELKHVLMFTQAYVQLTGIEPEDYEVERDGND